MALLVASSITAAGCLGRCRGADYQARQAEVAEITALFKGFRDHTSEGVRAGRSTVLLDVEMEPADEALAVLASETSSSEDVARAIGCLFDWNRKSRQAASEMLSLLQQQGDDSVW